MTGTTATAVDFVARVREANDIVDVIGEDVDLTPAGGCLKGLSPFHLEKTPSFVVWPDSQRWHDYSGGGGAGGDVFDYVMERESVGFREALRWLAERAGLRRPGTDDADHARAVGLAEERREVERLLTFAATYYHRALPAEIRAEWFRDHYGFTDATIDELQLGWADGGLFKHFVDDLGRTPEEALKTGLFLRHDDGVVDLFRGRLTLPFWAGGRVVYFAARKTNYTDTAKHEEPRYKNQLVHGKKRPYVSETVRNDYFYYEDAARTTEPLLITEGITDCISANQVGIPCISSATTQFQKRAIPKVMALTKRAKHVVICNDAEQSGAGETGALKTAAALFQACRDVRLATLPRSEGVEKVDVNDYLKAHAGNDLRTILSSAARYPEYYIDRIPKDTPPGELEGRLDELLCALIAWDPITQDAYAKRIAERFSISIKIVRGLLASRTDAAEREVENGEPTETTDVAPFRGTISQEADHYTARFDGAPHTISSFVMVPTKRLSCETGEVILADIKTQRGTSYKNIALPRSAFTSSRDLQRVLPSPDMQWSGLDIHVQGLLRLMSSYEVPKCQGTVNLGYVDTPDGPRWVAPGVVIDPLGVHAEGGIQHVPSGSTLGQRLLYEVASAEAVRALAADVLPSLLLLNDPAVVLPIIGWFFATPFRPRLVKLLGHFAILLVWGTQGSGKTSIIREIFWRLFGIATNTNPYSATETKFALLLLLSSTNSIPVFIDEYKRNMPHQQLELVHRLLRRIYGGETEERGRPDLSLKSYELGAPTCLAGESRPEGDPALTERMVTVALDKNWLAAHPESRGAFGRIRDLPLHRLASAYIQFALGRDTATDMEQARGLLSVLEEDLGDVDIPARCRDSMLVVVFGVQMYCAFARSLGVQLPPLDLLSGVQACLSEVLEGDRGVKDPFDHFLEALSAYAMSGLLVEDVHYVLVGSTLCLHLPTCHHQYLQERRRTGQEDDTGGLTALRRTVREHVARGGYVIDAERRIDLAGRHVRTVAVDLDRAGMHLDVTFPAKDVRGWGGARRRSSGAFSFDDDE